MFTQQLIIIRNSALARYTLEFVMGHYDTQNILQV